VKHCRVLLGSASALMAITGCSSGDVIVRTQAPPISTTTTSLVSPHCEDDGYCYTPLPGDYGPFGVDRGENVPNDGVLSGLPTGAELDALYADAVIAEPPSWTSTTTTTSASTSTTTSTTTVPVIALYRARNGDVARGELAARIYVERNVTQAAAQLGFTDFDPDGDGWALIGRTNGDGDNGPLARFWLVATVPHVSTRHPQKGCLELVPKSLARVTSGQTRFMDEFAQNTPTCRTLPPEADADGNGVADNVQPLYRARNGDVARGEVAARVYFERNLTASEATIGLSDFDPDSDGWALVGRTNGASDDGIAGPVTMNGVTPSATVTKANGTCLRITPVSLSVVARGQTRFVTSSPC
jgi:hypothetical protein